MNFKFELGETAIDIITEFEGLIIARSQHITGCNTYALKRKVQPDGTIKDAEWFDEPRLNLVNQEVLELQLDEAFNGSTENPTV